MDSLTVRDSRESSDDENSSARSVFGRFLRATPRIFGLVGLVSLFWSVVQSWTAGAIAAGIGTLSMAAFDYSLSHHFEDAWFQKFMIRVMKLTFAFLAFCAILTFGFLLLIWCLGI